jgi:hypothetical protein
MTGYIGLRGRELPIALLFLICPLLWQCQQRASQGEVPQDTTLLRARQLAPAERTELTRLISDRFRGRVGADAQYRSAGPFRFVSSDQFQYMDRTDVGSVVFESSQYGVSAAGFDSTATTREALRNAMEAALRQTGLDATGRDFVSFQDEFAGAAQPRGLSIPIDPRAVSRHVARTAEYRRVIDGIPVFGSELLIGLMADGAIGRFRLHWPNIAPGLVADARTLQGAVSAGGWTLPQAMRSSDVRVLEATAGVAHSGIADPGFRVHPVVRVTFRTVSRDSANPLSSTGYKYFDASGREVVFSVFPGLQPTAAERKRSEPRR